MVKIRDDFHDNFSTLIKLAIIIQNVLCGVRNKP